MPRKRYLSVQPRSDFLRLNYKTLDHTSVYASLSDCPKSGDSSAVHDSGLTNRPRLDRGVVPGITDHTFRTLGEKFGVSYRMCASNIIPPPLRLTIHVPASGVLEIEILNTQLSLDDALFDENGAAIVIHEGPDAYASDPAVDQYPDRAVLGQKFAQ